MCLADYFIRQGLFQKARDVFDEALANVFLISLKSFYTNYLKILTARDFGIVFNAYVKFEEEFVNMIAQDDQSEKLLAGSNEGDLQKTIDKILGNEINGQSGEETVLNEDYELDYRIDKIIEES